MLYFLVEQNRQGFLTIFRGELSLYIQQDQEIEEFLLQLSEGDRSSIERGWTTKVLLSDEYLTVMDEDEAYLIATEQLAEWQARIDEMHDRLQEVAAYYKLGEHHVSSF